MTKRDRIELLIEAQNHLADAIELIADALQGTEHEAHADAYILTHLQNWIHSRGYDMGVEQYIKEISEDE